MRCDIFAAIVALLTLLCTLSPGATRVLKSISRRILSFISPASVQCGTLCWEDILDGPLNDGDLVINHEPGTCLDGTFGRVFARSREDAARQKKLVKKPRDLDIETEYIRTDVRTLKAYALLAYEPGSDKVGITFEKVGKITTAHCVPSVVFCQGRSRTKDEVRLLLEGYPPFFCASIALPNGTYLPTPIQTAQDVLRAGWIVHLGLLPPSYMPGFISVPVAHTMQVRQASPSVGHWEHTSMYDAVLRLGRALDNMTTAFPDEPAFRDAVKLYGELRHGQIIFHSGWPMIGNWAFLAEEEWFSRPEIYAGKLTATQWNLAMAAVSHYEPLSPADIALLRTHKQPISQACFSGLIRALQYGQYNGAKLNGLESCRVNTLPAMSELNGVKYVYLTVR